MLDLKTLKKSSEEKMKKLKPSEILEIDLRKDSYRVKFQSTVVKTSVSQLDKVKGYSLNDSSRRKLEENFKGYLFITLELKNLEDEYEFLFEGYDVFIEEMVSYWMKYADLQSYEGLLFISSHRIEAPYQEVKISEKNIGKELVVLNDSLSLINASYYIHGGRLTAETKDRLRKFQEAKRILEEAKEEYPLLLLRKTIPSLDRYYSESVLFEFVGKEFWLEQVENYSKVKVTIVGEEGKIFDLTKENLRSLLDEIKESYQLKNELENPMSNYLAGIMDMNTYNNTDAAKREFEKLCSLKGGWEEVEKLFVELNKLVARYKLKVKEEQTGIEMVVFEKTYNQQVYYFKNYRCSLAGKEKREFEILIMNESEKDKIKQIVSEKLMEFV